jgi:hypothetical protein
MGSKLLFPLCGLLTDNSSGFGFHSTLSLEKNTLTWKGLDKVDRILPQVLYLLIPFRKLYFYHMLITLMTTTR